MEISGASFVKAKADSEISGFCGGVDRRQKVGGFIQKGKICIDEGNGIAREGV